ncbi:hypothetical protein SAY87_005973 [Trapa incisa]|uniref:Phospholipase/carboxylesterase/thioesterase domain-containing protein n=1 Tax=Trapa incisa TaxID=236973 RepID=A0AAN7KDE2_9MYRT|nr:hypothetical protein SAY87_005973 [Trapa incisa]
MATRTPEFGRTYVVRPRGKHQATIVWLHGLGENGLSTINLFFQLSMNVLLIQVKWICPTAPTRPVALFGGFACTAWFDVGDLSEDGPGDWEGLDASAAHIANFLSAEPADVKVGIGGFSMGSAAALYSAVCWATSKFGNGTAYPIDLRAVFCLSGWLPCPRNLCYKVQCSAEAKRRAASLPLWISHGTCDNIVPYIHGEKSARYLSSAGFRNLTFKSYDEIGHYTIPKEMADICSWLVTNTKLGLNGGHS